METITAQGPVSGLGGSGISHPHTVGRTRQIDPGDLVGEHLSAESLGLLTELDHQLRAHDPIGEAGVVLHVGGEHQLATGLVAGGRRLALDDQRSEVGPSRVDGRREPRRARADDDHIADVLPGGGHEARLDQAKAPSDTNSKPRMPWAAQARPVATSSPRTAAMTPKTSTMIRGNTPKMT